MRSTSINVAKALEAGSQAASAASITDNVKTSLETIRKGLASDVLNRDGNKQKIDKAIKQLDTVAARIRSIRATVDKSANAYYSTDASVQKNDSSIKSTGRMLTSGSNASAFRRG